MKQILPLLHLAALFLTVHAQQNSQFYMVRDALSKDTDKAICMGIDSQHTYLCTNTPKLARKALNMPPTQTTSHSIQEKFGSQQDLVNLGVTQRLSGSESEIAKVKEVLEEMMKYFDKEVLNRSEYEHVRENW
jgi:hypothetical protein